MPRPNLSLVPVFYHNYINQVTGDDLNFSFRDESIKLFNFLDAIPAAKRDHAYAPGKWTIQQVVQHLIDAERIFVYRALRFSRNDNTALSGFDENKYADQATAADRDWKDLIDEFRLVRKSSEYFFGSLNEEELNRSGVSSNNSITVIGLGYIVLGHPMHHKKIIEERYLH